MTWIAALAQYTGFSLFVAALVAFGGSLAIPSMAPRAMTMETMDRAFDIHGYQDQGHCDFWVVNMTRPVERIERSFACGFAWDWSEREGGVARVHEALYDHERGTVFQVPHMERGRMEEWYRVDGHMLTDGALQFQVEARQDPGVLMPPPGARGNLTMGWVESSAKVNGPERLVVARALEEVGTETLHGIETVHWTSTVDRAPAHWHGYELLLSEEVDLWSDPRTGWILRMERHVTVEMTPSQMAAAFGYQLPLERGEAQPIMELEYASTEEGVLQHVEEDRFFQQLITPVESWRTLAIGSGLAATGFASLGLLGRVVRRRATAA